MRGEREKRVLRQNIIALNAAILRIRKTKFHTRTDILAFY